MHELIKRLFPQIVAALVVLALASWYVNFYSVRKADTESKVSEDGVKIENLDEKSLDALLPKNLPLNGVLIQSYRAVNSEGQEQTTKKFVIDKDIVTAFELYKKYFDQNGWTILNASEPGESRVVLATRGTVKLSISLLPDGDKTVVEITLVK